MKSEMSPVGCFDESASLVKDTSVITQILSPQVSHSRCGQKVDNCVGGSRCIGTSQGPERLDRGFKHGGKMRLNLRFGTYAVDA